MMTKEDRARVIQGHVLYQGRWMSMEQKMELEAARRKKIEQGFVHYQGEWMRIDEKLERIAPHPKMEHVLQQPRQIIVNKTVNKQVYNIDHHTDNRTFHEHRHVHVDGQMLADVARHEELQEPRGTNGLEDKRRVAPRLPGKQPPKALPPGPAAPTSLP
jgi:hypothetical protein